MQPSPEAGRAADEVVLNLKRDKKPKTSASSRRGVLKAALEHEQLDILKGLFKASDETVVRYFVAVLADAWCLSDPGECLENYDLNGWNARKGDMPHAEQVRAMVGTILQDRDEV